jgi:murein endopeptidase
MKTLLLAIISLASVLTAGAQDLNVVQQPIPLLPMTPTGNSSIIRTDALPPTPPGWQVITMMPIIQNGNTVAGVQIFLHNPTTRANKVVGVRL